MRPLNYFTLLGISILLLSSCASIQQVADDDVYVTKNPALTTTEEVNDVSSYENFRYHKDRKLNRVRYGSTSAAIVFQQRYDNGYSSFNDPRYYNYGYGTVYGSAMYFQFGNFDTYHYGYPYYGNSYYNSYYNPYYNSYYYGNSCYGNPYYNGYNNNNYNSYGYTNQTTTANNYHYGPRNTLSGVNNFGRRGTQQTLGMTKNPNSGNGKNTVLASSSSQRKEGIRTNSSGTSRVSSSEVKSSRQISTGTGLSSSNKRVVTTTSSQRGSNNTYNNSSNSSSRSYNSGVSTTHGSSSGSSNTRSSEPSGGSFRSSGSSSGSSSSPRGGGSGSGSSTPTRRGGR